MFLRRTKVGKKTKMVVNKTTFRPILTYCSENWVLSNLLRSKVHAINIKYLRLILGVIKKDRIINDVIRTKL